VLKNLSDKKIHPSFVVMAVLMIIVICTTFLQIKVDDEEYFDLYDFEDIPETADRSDGVVTIREDTGVSENAVFSRITPIHLRGGEYTLEISHESDSDFTCRIYDGKKLIKEELLKAGETETLIPLSFPDDIYNLNVDFSYPGQGTVCLKHVNLSTSGMLYTDTVIYGILSLLLILFVFLYYRKLGNESDGDEKAFVFFALVAAAIIINYPVYSHYIQGGADFDHHLSRIENIRTELLRGHFPVVIYPEAFEGRGGMGALYPSVFLYIPAVLRILGMSVPGAFKIFEIIINLSSMGAAYYAVKRLTGERKAALLAAILYSVMPYRLLVMYFRDAVGEAQALIFIPLVIAGLYDCIIGETKKWPVLALGMAGSFGCHTLSVGMMGIVCIIFGAVYIKKIITDGRLISIIKAAALFIILSAWTLVPFLYYYFSDIDTVKWLAVRYFSKAALIPAQLFMLTTGIGSHSTNGLSKGIVGEDGMSLGVMGLSFFIIIIYDYLRKRDRDETDRFISVMFLISCLFNFMSTSAFPWATLEKIEAINNVVRMIQFPTRFQSVGLSLLVLSGVAVLVRSCTFEKERKLITVLILSFSLLQGFMMMDSFLEGNTHMTTKFTPDLINEFVNDYVPYGFEKRSFKDRPVSEDTEVISYERHDTDSYVTIEKGDEAIVSMPLVIFKGYSARMEDGQEIPLFKGDHGEICVKVPASTSERSFIVSYGYPRYFTIGAVLSVISFMIVAGMMIISVRRDGIEK